ncbi:MAG: ABC transporter ATP-binding protein [Kyrpidia tusciae]|nr:ABC transporter ATP-binding protein [Kyrpidia tusciae]MBE3552001.1 ABC transporter ATP-binding protein [Kyrpidia tusciae]
MRLVIDRVGKTFVDKNGRQTVALENIDLTISEEEFVAIVGPSGCGKSTLLNMVAGLMSPTSGEIYFASGEREMGGGESRASTSPRVAVVFQEVALFPWRTVLKNVEFGLEQLGVGRRERREIAKSYVEMVGLAGFEHSYPHQLSGGMRQRAGIARALAIRPDLLVMDEPLSALDAQTRVIMQEELVKLWEKARHKTLYVTHNIEEAVYLADRVVVLSRRPGRIIRTLSIELPRGARQEPGHRREIGDYVQSIWGLIREDAEKAMMEGAE